MCPALRCIERLHAESIGSMMHASRRGTPYSRPYQSPRANRPETATSGVNGPCIARSFADVRLGHRRHESLFFCTPQRELSNLAVRAQIIRCLPSKGEALDEDRIRSRLAFENAAFGENDRVSTDNIHGDRSNTGNARGVRLQRQPTRKARKERRSHATRSSPAFKNSCIGGL